MEGDVDVYFRVILVGFIAHLVAACSHSLFGRFGSFSSPNFPNNYPDNQDCVWNIAASYPSDHVALEFNLFRLEAGGSQCLYDFVEIRNDSTAAGQLLGKYCASNMPPRIISSGKYMRVYFHSDGNVTSSGFSANYVTSRSACSRSLSGLSGSFSSPNFPNNYNNYDNCVWSISVPYGYYVALNFSSFSLEYHSTCIWDFVEIRNGSTAVDQLLGKYCGSNITSRITSSGNGMRVYFHSDYSVTRSGFFANFVAILSVPAQPSSNVRGHNTSSTSIVVQWDDVLQADQNGIILGYQIKVTNWSGGETLILVSGSENRNHTLEGLEEFTRYNICVLAFTEKGVGPPICILVFTAEDIPAQPPSNVRGHNTSSTSIVVQWDDVLQADQNGIILGYQIKFTNRSGRETLILVSGSSNRNHTLEGLEEFTRYNICVLAFTAKGVGPPICILVVTAEDIPAQPPSNVRGHNTSSTSIVVQWDDVLQADQNGIILGYQIKFTNRSGRETLILVSGSSNRNHTLEGLEEFTRYNICVLAFTAKGVGPPICILVVTAEDIPAQPPSNVRGHNTSSTSIVVQWDDVLQADQNGIILGYQIKFTNRSGRETLILVSGSSNRNHTLEGLEEFTRYNICVLAFTAKGVGPPICILVVTAEDIPAQPPSNVRGHNTSSTSIVVQWDDVLQVDQNGIILGYQIKFTNRSGRETLILVSGSSSRNHTLEGLEEFTRYNICVLAFTARGVGPPICILVVTAEDIPAQPPSNVRGHNTSSTSIVVQWDDVLQADQNGIILGYQIKFTNRSGGETLILVSGSSNRNHTLEGLEEFTRYNICVLAFTAKGVGPPICILGVTAEDIPAQPPSNVRGHNTSSTSIVVQWDDVLQVDQNGIILGYQIKFTNRSGGETLILVSGSSSRNHTLEGLEEFTRYNICVLAFTARGVGPPICILVVTAEDIPAQPPSNVRGHNTSSTSIVVQWDDVLQADQNGIILGYQIKFTNRSGGETLILVSGSSNRNHTLEGLEEFTRYNICVLAFTAKGVGPPICILVVTAEDIPAQPPSNVRGHNTSSTSIVVQWDDVLQADQNGIILGYQIKFTNRSGGETLILVSGSSNRNHTLEGLEEFTRYNICVLAFTAKGVGPPICILVVTAEDIPAQPPSNVRGHNTSSTSIVVQWDDVLQADQNGIILGYQIKFTNRSGGETLILVSGSSNRNHTLEGLEEFTRYNICVLAFTAKGVGPPICILVVTAEHIPAQPPSNVRGHNTSSTSIVVQWDDVLQVDQNGIILGYQIKFTNRSGGETLILVSESSNRNHTLEGLEEFTRYNICVLAFTAKGVGPSICIFVVTADDNPSTSPQNLRGYAESSSSVLVQWDEVPPLDQNGIIKGYRIIYRTITSSINTSMEVDSSKRELLLVGLMELMYYSVCVSAFTSKGVGPFICIIVLTDSSPTFTAHPRNATVIAGEQATLSCTIRGRPAPTIVWMKDGRVLDLLPRFNVSSEGDTCSLKISRVSKSDHGEYSCHANNSIGSKTSFSGMLTVNYGPDFITEPANVTVVERQDLTLSCTAQGRPAPDIVWKKDGALLNTKERHFIAVTGVMSRLQINPVSRSDQGEYSCQANNSVNVAHSNPGTAIVNYPPNIFKSPVSQIKNETQNMSMSCTLEGKPRSDVKWLKDNKELAMDKRITLTNTNNTWSLSISSLRGEDGGAYACQATNEVTSVISKSGTLDVYYPPSVKKQLSYTLLQLGAELKLDCGAKGNPFPNITWTKDGSPEIPNARFSDRKRILTVDSVRADDMGLYQCAARNLLGFARSSNTSVDVETLLNIIDKGAVFTATEGDEEVKLRCQASSLETPTLAWKRGGKTFESTEDKVSEDGLVVSGYLILKDVKTEDAGQYICVARNGPKSVEAQIELIVNVNVEVEMDLKLESEEFNEELKNSSSSEFKELASEFETELSLLYQNTTGFKRVEVLGFLNGSVEVRFRVIFEIEVKKPEEEPPPDVKVKVAKVIIIKVTESKGKIGNLRIKPESIRPKVEPPAPQNFTATAAMQKTDIQLTWSPPEFHEIYDVLQYIVEFKRFKKAWEKRKTESDRIKTYRLTDLEADTEYLLKVSAENKYGISIPSAIRSKRTPPLPDPTDIYWKIWLPALLVFEFVFLFLVIYFYHRKRRNRRLNEDAEIDIRLQHLNYFCKNLEPEFSGWDDLAQRMLRGAWWEIPRNILVLGEELGSGMFGRVVKAWLQRESGESQVCAVKMLKASATELEYRDLANEVEIMSNVGEHPNLINLIGVCSVKGPLYVVVEFAENGSLLECLRRSGSNDSIGLLNIDKFIIALGVAKGMNHLAAMKCVHRDLSARNVLLAKNMTPKVADFGLSRDVYERGFYEKTTGGKLPIRWMAIEALERFVFTSEGDVWSFGVLLWEIETEGQRLPYAGLNMKQLLRELKSGYRLGKPTHCTDDMYDLMMWCWLGDPTKRPTFQDLCIQLQTIVDGYKIGMEEDC